MEQPTTKSGAQLVREFLESPAGLRQIAAMAIGRRGAGAARRDWDDAVNELSQSAAVQLLQKADAYDPRRGTVRQWIFRVVQNCHRDRLRAERSRKKVLVSQATAEWALDEVEIVEAETEPWDEGAGGGCLSEPDLVRLEKRLNPVGRVVGIVMLEMYDKIPQERLEAWLVEAGLGPIPHEELQGAGAARSRQIIMGWTGKTANNLSQIRMRARAVVADLEYVRGLRGEERS